MQVVIEPVPEGLGFEHTNCAYCHPSDYITWSSIGTHIRLLGKNPYFAYKLEVLNFNTFTNIASLATK
jgi:hypothetical protein